MRARISGKYSFRSHYCVFNLLIKKIGEKLKNTCMMFYK